MSKPTNWRDPGRTRFQDSNEYQTVTAIVANPQTEDALVTTSATARALLDADG